jgi:phosphate transport system substrate-binding protein
MTMQVRGSDTMVNLAQLWAEEYNKVEPNVSIEVCGGGTGVGLAALFRGTVDMANASRNAKPAEIEQAKENTGKEPVEFVMGYDALAIYVHKDNPLDQITEEQLAEIYAEGGKTTKWSQLSVKVPGRASDHPRQPPIQFRHLRAVPRARPEEQRLQAGLPGYERVERSRGSGGINARGHWL